MKQLDDSDVFDDYNQDNLTHLNRLLTEVRKFVKAFKADKLTTFRAKYISDSRQNLFEKLEELDQKLESFFKTRHPSPKAVYSDQISVSSAPVDQGSEEPAKIRSFLQKQDELRLLKQVSNLVDQLNGKTESKDLKQLFNQIKDDFKSIKEVNLNKMVDRYIMLKKYCSDPNHDSDPLSAELERKYYDFIKRQFKDKGENIDGTILEELKTNYPFLNKLNDYNEHLISDAKQNLPVLQFTRSILANLVNAASGEHVSSLQEGVEDASRNIPDYQSELSDISTLIEQVSLPKDSFVDKMSLTPSLVRGELIKRQGSSVQLSEITLEMNEDDPNQQEQVDQLIQQIVQQNKPDLTGFEAQVSTLMTHMFLDADANSSYLEGANQSDLMGTFNCILKSMASIDCVDEKAKMVIEELAEASQKGIGFEENVKKYGWSENASSIEKALNEIKLNLKEMKPKTFMVIPFGWNNTQKTKTGHATYIKLICEGDDKFTIQHFNLGGGCNNHQQKKWSDESNQFLYFPFTQISNVSIKKLTSPNFLKHFYDVKCNEHIKWTYEDIGIAEVEATLKYLGDFDEPDSYQSELPRYQKTQQSGLCTFHSLRALIIDSLSPKNYAIFNMVSGLKVLHSFEDQCVKQKGMMTPSNLQTLERCILRFIDELKLRKSKLNNAQKVFIQTEVDALLIRVQSRIKALALRNVQSFEPGKEILYKAKIGMHPNSSSRTEPLQKVTYSTIDSDFSDVNASSLKHNFSSLLNECDKLSNQGQFDHILKLVNRSISTLPSFTPEIYSDPNVMNQLLKLSEFLMQSFSRLNNSKDVSYRHQLDCILSHAKSLILIIKTLQQNYPLPSNYPQNQKEAFGCLIHGLMINESLEKLRSTVHTYGNACVYDSDQQQLFKEIKTELDGIAPPHPEKLERTKHKSVALKDYIELKLTDQDDKSPYHPAFTLASFNGDQKSGFNEKSLFESGEMHDGYKQFLKALHYYDIATSFEMMKPDSGSFDIEFMRYNNIYKRATDTRSISNKKMIEKQWAFYTQSEVFPNQIQSRELKTILELKQKTGDRKSDALFLKERTVNDKHSNLMLELENLVSKNHSQSEAQHGVSLGHIISFFKSRLDLLSNKTPAFKGTLDDYANDIGIDSMYNHDLMSSLIIRIKEESFVTDFVARLKKQDNSAKSLKYYNLLTGEKKTKITDKNDFFKDFEAKAKKDRLINTLETVDRSDYREFFKQLLLSESLNESVFESFNALKPELIKFLNSSYDEFKNAKDFEACAFIVKIMVLVESRLGHSIEKSDFNCLGKLTDLENELQKVVSDIDYKKDDLLYLLNELRLVYIGNIKGLQDESLELYIKAAQFTSEAYIESPFYDIDIAHICANTRIKLAVPLQGLIKERPDVLTGLRSDASAESFATVAGTLCFESNNYEYDCYKAQFVKKGVEAEIPKKLKYNPMFIALYNEQELLTVENGYSFHLNGMTVNFENTSKGFNVRITHEETTYLYAGNTPFNESDSTNPLPNYLISNYHLFYKDGRGSECIFLNKATNKMEYMGVMDGYSLKDIKDSNGYNLKQLKGSVFECFFSTEEPKNIMCFESEDLRKAVLTFTKLGVQFEKSPKKKSVDQIFETEKRGKLFYCTHPDLKGYYLDENQYTRHIPGLNGGLRLTNGHETKIIFPSYHIKHTDDVAALLNKNSEEDKAVLMPSYKFSSEQIPNLPPFLIYDESELILDSVKERSNSNRQKDLFLLYMLCKTENITSAFNLLNVHMVDQFPFSTEELTLLKLIQNQTLNKNRSFQTALHLKVVSKLISTYTLAHHEQVKSESKSDLKDLLDPINIIQKYTNYLKFFHSVEGIGLSREEERLICQYCIDFGTDELSEEIIERAKSFNKQLTEKISSTVSNQVIELKSEYVSAFFKVKSLPRSCFHSREVETYYNILKENPRNSKRCEEANEWLRIHLNRQPDNPLLVALEIISEEWPNHADYDFLKAVIEYDSRSGNEWEANKDLNDHIKNYYSVKYMDKFNQLNSRLNNETGMSYVKKWLQNARRYGDVNSPWMRALILNAEHGYKVAYDSYYYKSEVDGVLSDFCKFDQNVENITEIYGYLLEDPSSQNHKRAKEWLRLATWLMPTNTIIQAFNFWDSEFSDQIKSLFRDKFPKKGKFESDIERDLEKEIEKINANNIEVPERTIEPSSDVVNPNEQSVSGGSLLTLEEQAYSLTLPRQLIAKMVLLEGTKSPGEGDDVEIHSPVGTSSAAEFDYKQLIVDQSIYKGQVEEDRQKISQWLGQIAEQQEEDQARLNLSLEDDLRGTVHSEKSLFKPESRSAYLVTNKLLYIKSKQQLEKTILEQANQAIQWHNGSNTSVGINEIIHAFLAKNTSAYQRLNSTLSSDDCEILHQLIFDYLTCINTIHKLDRINDLVKQNMVITEQMSNESDESKKQLLINKQQAVLLGLFDELNIDLEDHESKVNVKPLYDPIKYPEFLVFEAKTGMGLRQKQVEKLEEIIKELDNNPPTENIHQMIMGFGKTKVLLPILAQRLADGNHLSMVIVPDELLDDVVGDLNKKSANIFGQKPFLFKFDRNTSLNDGDLDMLEQQLKESISAQNPIVSTSKSMHCLRLRYIEELANINHLNAQLEEHSVHNLPVELIAFHQANHSKLMSEKNSKYEKSFDDYANSPELLYEKSKNELERVEGYAQKGKTYLNGLPEIIIPNYFSEFLDKQFGDLNHEVKKAAIKRVKALRLNESEINTLMDSLKGLMDLKKEVIDNKKNEIERNKETLNNILVYLKVASIDELKEKLDDADIQRITENCKDDEARRDCYWYLTGDEYKGEINIGDFKVRLKTNYKRVRIYKIKHDIKESFKKMNEIKTTFEQEIKRKFEQNIEKEKIAKACMVHKMLNDKKMKHDQTVNKLNGILGVIKQKGRVLIDEADTILNCKNEVNFTMGDSIKPPDSELKLLAILHRKLLGCDDGNYTDYIIEKLSQDPNCLGEDIMAVRNSIGEASFSDFLKGAANDVLSDSQLSLAYLLKEQCCELLNVTKSRKIDENYGLSNRPEEVCAVPYLALNTPSKTSRFDQIHEVLNYTIQMYQSLNKIPEAILRKHLLAIYNNLILEQQKGVAFNDTLAKQAFERFFPGIDSQLITNQQNITEIIQQINQAFQSHSDQFDDYLVGYILPQITTNSITINSNSFDIVDMFKTAHGFTGTPWNSGTFHERLGCVNAKGTDGESFNNLMQKVDDIRSLERDGNYTDVINSLSINESTRALIDCGALLRGASNDVIAAELLTKVQSENGAITSIVFYHHNKQTLGYFNEDGSFVIGDYKKDEVDPNTRFTFYDQAHTVGSDIHQIETAQAILTVAENVKQRDMFQAMWRMRGISKGQRLQLVLNKKLKSQIDDESTGEPRNDIIKAIIRHVTKNQYDQKLGQLIQTAEGRFNHISRQQEFDQLCKYQRQASDVEVVESFLKKKQIDPNVIYRTAKQQVERDETVDGWAEKFNHDGIDDRVAALKAKATKLLPEEFESPVVSHDVTAEVQQEVQQEVQKEKEKQTQSFNIQSKPNHIPVRYKDVFGSIKSINGVGGPLKCEPPFSEDETALFTIKASGNFQTVATLYSSRTPAGLKNQTQLPCRHIVMYKDEDGKTKGIMLHNIDVEMLMDDYSPNPTVSAILDGSNEDKEGNRIKEYGIFTISNNDVVCEHYITEEGGDMDTFKNTDEFKQLVVEAKLFNGELVLTKDERRIFSQNLDQGKKARWLEFITKNTLESKKIPAEEFEDHALHALLTNL